MKSCCNIFWGGINYDITQEAGIFEVPVVWGNTALSYNGNPQRPNASATDINGGSLPISVAGEQTNAGGPYTATATTTNLNYVLTNATTTFTIAPANVPVVWGITTLTYTGNPLTPNATATLGGTNIPLTISGAQTNVGGPYTATAAFQSSQPNYTLTNTTTTFTIVSSAVAVTGVSLDKSSITMNVGETTYLTATLTPSTATNQKVKWSSSNAAVAKPDLNEGPYFDVSIKPVITALSAGTAVITATTEDGDKTATCTVTVTRGGTTPFISFSLTSLSYNSSGGEQTFIIISNTDWTVTCPASWVSIAPVSGSNNETVTVNVLPNTTGAPRSTTLSVSGTGVAAQSINVTQSNTVASEHIASPPLTAYARDGVLHVSGLTVGESWRVYTILGTLVASPSPSEGGESVLPLPGRGVYIVSDGKSVVKVVN